MKRTIRLNEKDLHRIISESVKRMLGESIDSVSPDPFGTNADSYHSPSTEELRKGREFDNKHCPWRNNPNCQTLEDMIEWGCYVAGDFESGKLNIRNFLSDLNDMANGF